MSTAPDEWPLALRPIKLLAKPSDTGLGDIIQRVIGDENSEAFQRWFKEVFKNECGCHRRKEYLNRKFPLINNQSP